MYVYTHSSHRQMWRITLSKPSLCHHARMYHLHLKSDSKGALDDWPGQLMASLTNEGSDSAGVTCMIVQIKVKLLDQCDQ